MKNQSFNTRIFLNKMFVSGLVCFWACVLTAQSTPMFQDWNRPVPPFQIKGKLYYVGVAQVTSLLIATNKGHILIDGAFAESAPRILENVRKLGFKPEDIKILLSTHAHLDHAGGLAEIKAKTGARLYAGAEDAPALARGGLQDFAFGDKLPFPPVSADVLVNDGDKVSLGDVVIRAIATPGHTKGCISWAFTIHDDGKPWRVVMIGGMSAPNYQLTNNPEYPQIATDFAATFQKLKTLECDIFLEGHGFYFGLEEKAAGKKSFVNREGYLTSIANAEKAFCTQLEEQRSQSSPGKK